jgi:nitroreductase
MTTLPDAQTRPVSAETLLKQLGWRYATKRFDPARKLAPADVAVLEQAITLSPSSFGLQPWKFIVVTDPAMRQKLRPAAHHQPQIVDASHLVVLTARKGLNAADVERFIDSIGKAREAPAGVLDGYKKIMLDYVTGHPPAFLDAWCARQVYIALGVLLSTAAALGIDACPMEGFEREKFNQILGLDGYTAVVLCTLGYRAADDPYAGLAKVRYSPSDVIVHV